jgi:hypothetical protein
MTNLRMEPFIKEFDEEYAPRGIKWAQINPKIHKAIADVFMAFSVAHPEIDSKMSRAYYGVDIMVNQDLEAKLLEVTFSPDMERFTIF